MSNNIKTIKDFNGDKIYEYSYATDAKTQTKLVKIKTLSEIKDTAFVVCDEFANAVPGIDLITISKETHPEIFLICNT